MTHIPTGYPSLDQLLDGGLPASELTVIAGPVGCGKTTALFDILANITSSGREVVLYAPHLTDTRTVPGNDNNLTISIAGPVDAADIRSDSNDG